MRCSANGSEVLKLKTGQSPTELVTRLTDTTGMWLEDFKTVVEMKDTVVKDQMMAARPEHIGIIMGHEHTPRPPPKTTCTNDPPLRRVGRGANLKALARGVPSMSTGNAQSTPTLTGHPHQLTPYDCWSC